MNLSKLIDYLKNSRLVKDAGIYTIFKVLDKVIPFLLLPIVTRILNPNEYGVFVLFQALAGIALPLMTLSVDSSILLNYYKTTQEEFKKYFSSGYVLLILSSIISIVVFYSIREPISSLTEFPASWIIAILMFCFFQFHSNLALNMFQVEREPGKYGIYSVSLTAFKNGLMLLFVIYFGMKWQGIIVGYLVAYFLFFVVSHYFFNHRDLYTLDIKKDYILDSMKVGYPLSIHVMGSWAADAATKVIIGAILGEGATGSFGIGATIGIIVKFIQDSFNKAYVPYLFDNLKRFNEKVENKLIKITYLYNVALLVLAIVVGVIGSSFLEVIFGSAYKEGKQVVLLLCIAYAFNGMYKMHVNYIFYEKKTHIILLITLTTGSLNIGLSYLFVGLYGIWGGALSLCIVNVVGYILSWYLGNKVWPMKWFSFSFMK